MIVETPHRVAFPLMGNLLKIICSAERKRAKGKLVGTKSTRPKEKLHAQCGVLKAKVQRSTRPDKRICLESLAREVESAIKHHKQGLVYRIGLQNTYLRCITFK